MGVLELSTVSLAVLSVVGCSPGLSSDPTPPAKAAFDPLPQSKQRAVDAQKTVDQNSDATRLGVDAQQGGESSPEEPV